MNLKGMAMKRLDGVNGVERIMFGRELFGLRRRRALFCCLTFVLCLGAVISAVIFFIDREDSEKPPQSMEAGAETTLEEAAGSLAPSEESKGNNGEDTDGQTSEEITAEAEEETKGSPIVYKDFGTSELRVVNNTAFDISFLNFTSPSLSKYYDKSSAKPIVLVLHTYTSDRYADSATKYGVCAAGQAFVAELNSMGIGAVYSSAVHDGDLNDPAENARETIEFYLKMYPSIKYIFDIGVMQEYDGDKIIATDGEYMGQRAAQIRILVSGNNLATNRDNLYLASEIGENLRRGGMTLAGEIVYNDSIGNSIMTPYYLEVFIGSSGNTESEAVISSRVLAAAFAQFLS